MIELNTIAVKDLLNLHAKIAEELRSRRVIRSANNPTGDLAEILFCRAMGWKQAGNSHPSADATAQDGTLYQIKGCRMSRPKSSRQLGAFRNLPDCKFQFLAAVLFKADYSVHRAAIVSHALVLQNSYYTKHTNSWLFYLRDPVWDWPEVLDVTDDLRRVEL
jgi:hypothetical protein